jgi:hypothetical protein
MPLEKADSLHVFIRAPRGKFFEHEPLSAQEPRSPARYRTDQISASMFPLTGVETGVKKIGNLS